MLAALLLPLAACVGGSEPSIPIPTSAAPAPTISAAPTSTASGMVAPSADDLGASGLEALAELTEAHSPRASASAEERAAAMYIAEQFKALGYTTEIVPFSVELPRTNPPVLQVDHPLAEPVGSLDAWTLPLENSGEGEATGVLRAVGKGLLDEVTPASLTGRVALIERGIITFQEKVSRVADAGAVAAVIYNNRDGAFSGRLTGPSEIPAVAVSRERGEALLELMSSGNVEATVSVVFETRESANVVAELKGADPDGGVVVLGGHYDTVPNVPGVNDNGSGIAVMLTIARQASQSTYPFTLRFIAFGSEEIGLLGSQRYVDSLSKSELADIVAMFNFDALGTGDTTVLVATPWLGELFESVAVGGESRVQLRRSEGLRGASSDHAPFAAAGISFAFVFANDLSRIHTPEDVLEHVDPRRIGEAVTLAIATLDALAAEPRE